MYDDIIRDMVAEDDAPPALDAPRPIFHFFLRLWKTLHDQYQFVNDQAQSKESPFGDLDSSFLIASPGGIFKVSSDLGVTPFLQYYAIGSGSEYALARSTASTRVRATPPRSRAPPSRRPSSTTSHCGGPVDLMEVGDG